jgi:hypothetical protein
LRFEDGKTVGGTVTAAAASDRVRVEYSGEVNLLGSTFVLTKPPMLRLWFQHLAQELGAEYSESINGEYDYAE